MLIHPKGAIFPCPVCGKPSPVYDHQKWRWRHLDTYRFTTIPDLFEILSALLSEAAYSFFFISSDGQNLTII